MADVVLTTLNARYAHAAFGLRYLLANLPPLLRERAEIVEFDLNQRPVDMLEVILARRPSVVGVGVYIWNVEQATRLVADLKRVRPDVVVVLGGPEVSFETDQQEIVGHADHVVIGEADLAFADLCEKLLSGRRPLAKLIPAELPEFSRLALPYDLYSDEDVAHRVVYVEASRGCPFRCEFCLSSLDVPVRNVPLDAVPRPHAAAARPGRAAVQVRRPHVQPEPQRRPLDPRLLPRALHAGPVPPLRDDPGPPPGGAARADPAVSARGASVRGGGPDVQRGRLRSASAAGRTTRRWSRTCGSSATRPAYTSTPT